jgi:hypothetical protein
MTKVYAALEDEDETPDPEVGRELIKFHNVTSVGMNGDLLVSASKYSRTAIIMAFEMMGGIESFAEWAMNNKSEFYTKMFGKVIGKETEQGSEDPVEDYLKILDAEAEDVTPADAPANLAEFVEDSLTGAKLAFAAEAYAAGELLDGE